MTILRSDITKTKEQINSRLRLLCAQWTGIPAHQAPGDYTHGQIDALRLALSSVKSFEYRHCCGDADPSHTHTVCYSDVSNIFE